MDNWIAIDFGTSTVKAAYLDADGEPRALHLGAQGYTIPSVFHLSGKTGELSIGDRAEEMGEEDPSGDIPFLKRNLKKPLRRWGKRIAKWWSKIGEGKPSDEDLQREFLVKLFQDIRKHVEERIDVFQGKPPTAVCLTVTSCYSPDQEKLLYEAAEQAGFEKIDKVAEPLAAARMWKGDDDARHNHAVVLDCGGGTTDWAYVRRESGSDFQIEYAFTPGGVEIGGSNVDKELYRRVQAELKRNGKGRANRRHLMRKVRKWKEDCCDDYPVDCEFRDTRIALTASDIKTVIDKEFIQPVFKELKPFVDNWKKELGEEKLPVLLVGGSHKLKGLEKAVDEQLGCKSFLSEHKITAQALGALLWVKKEYAVEEPVEEPEKEPEEEPEGESEEDQRLRLEVANHFLEVAELIGVQQDYELKLASGRTVVPGLGMLEPAAALVERADRLENGGMRLAVVGARSRGKSTLINALLGEDLLPVGRAPTTAVITLIVNGKKQEVTLVEKNDKGRTVPRKEFHESCMLTPKNKVPQEFANVDHAVLESNTCRLCNAGLQLVDTLGLHRGRETAAITRRYLNQVDAVLLVISDERPFNDDTDIDFIDSVRREGNSGLDHVFFLINDHGLDDKGKEEVLGIARGYLEPELGEAFEHHVFLVNAKSAMDSRVEDRTDATNLPAFEREIERFLKGSGRVKVILESAVRDVLSPAIAAARSRMNARKKFLAQSQEDMETTIRDFKAKQPQLQEKAESIHGTFNGFASKIADTIADNAISILEDLISDSEWVDLDIGGNTEDYMKKTGFSQREQLSRTIQRRIRMHFKREISDAEFKDIDAQLRTLSKTLEREIASFFNELNRNEAPWFISNLRKVLSTCQKRVITRIIGAYSLKPSVIGDIVEQQIPKGAVAWIAGLFSSDEKKSAEVQRDVKWAIRRELRHQFEVQKHTWRREIQQSVAEVFTAPSEKLQKNLIGEFERREHLLKDILKAKRSGVEDERARLRRLETINTCLDEAFHAICESVESLHPKNN